MSGYQRGQKLIKNYDGREVVISRLGSDHIVLDGDFEPDHVVMRDKISSYYSLVKEQIKPEGE